VGTGMTTVSLVSKHTRTSRYATLSSSDNNSLGIPSMKLVRIRVSLIQMHKYKHWMGVSKHMLEMEMEVWKHSYMQKKDAKTNTAEPS